MSYKIAWPQLNRVIEAREGQTVLEAAIENDIPLDHACGGYCACTTCHIVVKNGADRANPIGEDELDRLDGVPGSTAASRLACQTLVKGDLTVEIP